MNHCARACPSLSLSRPRAAASCRGTRSYWLGLSLLMLLVLSACGSSGSSVDQAEAEQRFSLSLHADTYLGQGSADSITLRELPATRAEKVRVRNFAIEVQGARQLKALVAECGGCERIVEVEHGRRHNVWRGRWLKSQHGCRAKVGFLWEKPHFHRIARITGPLDNQRNSNSL